MVNVNNKILRLAVPNIISNISVPILGMVDMALLGHLKSPLFLGAMALASVIFNFLYWSFGFLRMGTTGMVAQAFGEQDENLLTNLFFRATIIGLSIGLVCIVFQSGISHLGFWLVEGSESLKAEAVRYFSVRIWAAPATIGLYALMGWSIGIQNARLPMFITLLINCLNVALSYLLIYKYQLNVVGAAAGTLVAQYVGFLSMLFYILYKYKWLRIHFNLRAIFNSADLLRFFTVNRDIFIRTICLLLVFNYFTSASAGLGADILAMNTLLMQFLMFFSYLIDGFAYAAEALVGELIGAKAYTELRRLIQRLFLWGGSISIAFCVVYGFFGQNILHLLTDQQTILDEASAFLPWLAILPVVAFASYLWDGIYIGATASKWMRNTSFLAAFVVFFPIYFSVRPWFPVHGLWFAMIFYMGARGLLQWLLLGRAIPILKRNIEDI
ncbi:MATE family efflux transporter (plasmid) [Persicobacter psychrovividus]|uniref:MATE family efflux transporter n=1 Tax=Persicobacter psychrovividus TaxID=387638 RepID=A0ABN6LFM9_9BACT|nr:MATE family efflux transporter [Persicobacter psychrovividus]